MKKMYHYIGDDMKRIVEIAHDILQTKAKPNGVYADLTCGNGYDTCFLAGLKDVKKVYAFDIQKEALQQSAIRLQKMKLDQHCELIHGGHEHMELYIKEALSGAIFNFGYLPHGSTEITTKLETSMQAVEKALKLLEKHGILILVIYPGHDEGKKESAYFSTWVKELDSHYYATVSLKMENKQDAPYLLVVEKMRIT